MPELKGDPGLPPLRVLLGLQPLTTTAYSLRVLRGSLDQLQASGAAQLDLAGRTPRTPLRDSNITSDLAEVFFQPIRMASYFISARLNLRFLAADRGGAQGMKKRKPEAEKSSGHGVLTLPGFADVREKPLTTHNGIW
jgi:hypothetical protein